MFNKEDRLLYLEKPNMEIRHLRAFVVVARELHFARAAELLGISAPTLTVQIQELERAVQARLLQRTKRSVALTPAGVTFLAESEAALAQFDHAVDVGRRAGRGEVGAIALGYVGSAAYSGVLQDQTRRFLARWPDVEIRARELPMDELPSLLEEGKVDVAIVRTPVSLPASLSSRVLARDRFCLALPQDHPLARGAGPVLARSLAGESFVVPEQDSGLQEVARRGRFTPHISAVPGSLLAVLTQVSVGASVAVVPSVLRQVIALPHVVYRDIAGAIIPSQVAAIYRRHERAPGVRRFVTQILETPEPKAHPKPLDAD